MNKRRRFAKYELVEDGQYTRLDYIGDSKRDRCDGYYYFYSLKAAERALVKYFKERRDSWALAYQDVKKRMTRHE